MVDIFSLILKYLIIALVLLLIPELIFFMKHKNYPYGKYPEKCIELGLKDLFIFNYKEHGFFIDAFFIGVSSKICISPGFPAIKLKASYPINGWIQVIETDSKKKELKWFIDSVNNLTPFYTLSPIIFDSPQWGGIGFYFKCIQLFRARAYPVEIKDDINIVVYPAIEWGFFSHRLKFSLSPIEPKICTQITTMKDDFREIIHKFPIYNFILAF